MNEINANIWHNINVKRVTPTDFICVIESPREVRINMNWIRKPVILFWTGFFILLPTILQTTALFPVPTAMTVTP